MKKLLAITLVTGVFLVAVVAPLQFPTVSYATSNIIDLSGYTDDEIVTLLTQVQNEVVNRRIEMTATLPGGTYIVGDDIPAGKYTYAVIVKEDVEIYGDGYQFGIVSVRSVNDPKDEFPSKLFENVDNREEFTKYLSLENGDTLKSPVSFTLSILVGLMFK